MRTILLLLVLTLIVGPIVFAVASFQSEPSLPQAAELSPQRAAQSKQVVRRAKAAAGNGSENSKFVATQDDLDALIATLGRVAKPLRGQTQIDDDGLRIALSAQVPGLPAAGWVNFAIHIVDSDQGLDVRSIQLGKMSLPPGITVSALTFLLDALSSEDIGTLLISSVKSVSTSPGTVVVTLDSGGTGDDSLFSRVVSGVRESIGIGDASNAARYYAAMDEAAANGTLPSTGSVAPWFSFALSSAAESKDATDADLETEVKAALLALASHCGDRKAIGVVAGDIAKGFDKSRCSGTKLAGRSDLRKHFALSAAFQAAGGSAASFGLGEVKELVDAGSDGGSGFSFDDIAADRSGIRFAETARAADADLLSALAAEAMQESALMPSIDGLESQMSEAQFLSQFGGVDAPEYKAMIERIDARIDALPLYAQ